MPLCKEPALMYPIARETNPDVKLHRRRSGQESVADCTGRAPRLAGQASPRWHTASSARQQVGFAGEALGRRDD